MAKTLPQAVAAFSCPPRCVADSIIHKWLKKQLMIIFLLSRSLNSTSCNSHQEFAERSASASPRLRSLLLPMCAARHLVSVLGFLLVCCALSWDGVVEAQTTGRFASLAYDQALLQKAVRFGALELAFPKFCAALPDSLKQLMEAQVNEAKPYGFQYKVEHVCGLADGHTLILSSIVNREPPFNFAYLEGYEPVERGLQDSLQVRSLDSGAVALREYSFVRSGFSVKQVFVETPEAVYQLDILIRTWNDTVAKTYESVLSSIHIIR